MEFPTLRLLTFLAYPDAPPLLAWMVGARSLWAVLVTCGSVIKVRHEASGYHLHSHSIKWGGGSGQQSVTAHGSEDDQGSMWIVSSRLCIGSPFLAFSLCTIMSDKVGVAPCGVVIPELPSKL